MKLLIITGKNEGSNSARSIQLEHVVVTVVSAIDRVTLDAQLREKPQLVLFDDKPPFSDEIISAARRAADLSYLHILWSRTPLQPADLSIALANFVDVFVFEDFDRLTVRRLQNWCHYVANSESIPALRDFEVSDKFIPIGKHLLGRREPLLKFHNGIENRHLTLSATEHSFLLYLALVQSGKDMDKANRERFGSIPRKDQLVHKLKAKIAKLGGGVSITHERGQGYRVH